MALKKKLQNLQNFQHKINKSLCEKNLDGNFVLSKHIYVWKLNTMIERIELNMVEKEVVIVSFNEENQHTQLHPPLIQYNVDKKTKLFHKSLKGL